MSNEIGKNPPAPFRGNRFNILFYDAGAVYYLASLIKKFLAGCKALGLINKLVTGPLWRVIDTKDVSILDMNTR